MMAGLRRETCHFMFSLLLKLVDFLSDGAAALVDAAAVAAVRLGDCAVLQNDFHHAASVQLTAVAGYKFLCLHVISTMQKPLGASVSQSGATVCRL